MDEEAIEDGSGKVPDSDEPTFQINLQVSAFSKVLRNRDFMALWMGQGISSIGDWVIVGVLLDTVNRMGGTTGLFWMLTFRFLPAFLFGLIAGAVVDRLERKTLMIICEIARCLLVVALAFASSLWLICMLVFSIETFTLLFGPAKDSSIPDLVKTEEVITANSIMSTTTYLTMALGTMIATVILGVAALIYSLPLISTMTSLGNFQHTFAFLVDALTFVASAMLIWTIAFPRKWSGEDRPKISAPHVWRDFKEGMRFMRANRLTRAILSALIIGFIGGGSLYILGAPFSQQVLRAVGSKFTLVLTMLLFGVVAGAAAAPWAEKRLSMDKWFSRAAVSFGVIMVVFAWVDFYPASLLIIFFGGIMLGYLLVSAYTLLHHNLEEEVRGRVFAAFQTIMRTCLLLSMGIFILIEWIFERLIPWTPRDPVYRTLDLGLFTKSVYPAMLSLMVGGIIVIAGGLACGRMLKTFFQGKVETEADVEGTDTAT